MSLTAAWKRFFYFILAIILLVGFLVLVFTIGIFVLIIVTVIAIIGIIIRLLFFRRKKQPIPADTHTQQGTKQQSHVIDAEIIEENKKNEAAP